MSKKIIIRAEGNERIGFGHVVRCITLANLLKYDYDIVFCSQNPTNYHKNYLKYICPVIKLNDSNVESLDFLNILDGSEIVVLDNYFYSLEYQNAIKSKGCKLVSFVALKEQKLNTDLAINCWGTERSEFTISPQSKYVSGLEWAPLRKEFYDSDHETYKPNILMPRNVVIAFGGSDYLNLTEKVLRILMKYDLDTITAIVGENHKLSDIDLMGNICIKRNIPSAAIVEIFKKNDIAIIPSSTMAIEALFCGINLISGYYVDNQKLAYNTLLTNKQIVGVGDFRQNDLEKKLNNIFVSNKILKEWKNCGVDLEKFTYEGLKQRYVKIFSEF